MLSITLFNWRSGLALVAIAIVTRTIFYSQYLAKKIMQGRTGESEHMGGTPAKAIVNNPGMDLTLATT